MNWNSQEFIWLDWTIMAVGILAIVWAIWHSIQKHKSQLQGADSQDYLFGKGEPWYIIGAAIFAANIGSEHLGRACRYRCKGRCWYGTLGDARLDDPYFGLAFCAVLSVDEH